MIRQIVPDLVSNQTLTIVHPGATVAEAAKAMADRNIGAVLIAEEGHLLGIFTERDLVRRVVALGRDAKTTEIDAVMTSDPATVAPTDAPGHALALMRRMGCRHLPVLDGERLVGVLSIRDLYAALQRELDTDERFQGGPFRRPG